MACWICDFHKLAGKLTKRDIWKKEYLFPDLFEECELRIVSDDNAIALGWERL